MHIYAVLFIDIYANTKVILVLLLFVVISIVDIETHEIPYIFNIILFTISLFFIPESYHFINIIILCMVFIFCLLGWMGFGDFFFLISNSIYLNDLFLYVLPLACLFALLYVFTQKEISSKEIPFLPFLTLATIILLLLR